MVDRLAAIVLFLVASAVTGCATAPSSKKAELIEILAEQSFWQISAFGDGELLRQEAVVTINPHGTAIQLSDSCRDTGYSLNSGSGNFASGPWMVATVPNPGMFDDDCSVRTTHTDFMNAIFDVADYRQTNDGLSLDDINGASLINLVPLDTSGLENRRWQIEYFFDGKTLVSTRERLHAIASDESPSLPVTFMFGRIDGSSGCGRLHGGYSPREPQSDINISAFSVLAGWCHPEDQTTAGEILDALNGDRSLEKDGENFLLRDAEGVVQVILSPSRM
jgi:hypothetical protein